MASRGKWAILVGINKYTDDKPVGERVDKNGKFIQFGNLRGCLNDIDRIEQYLLDVQRVQKDHIFRLCSPLQPMAHYSSVQEPTAENIKKILENCTAKAKPGDIVYFHYSGHGARVSTLWPDIKGTHGIDECLVPSDVAYGGKFLRDVELESILSEMTKKGLVVTVTLDSCHSGGAFERGDPSVVARGIEGVVENLETDQPLTDLDHSNALFQRYNESQPRGGERGAWILKPQDYALLAACGPHEKAHEADEQGVCYGTFTHWLLETIKSDSHSTHRTICDRISIKVRNRHPGFQSPVGAGALDRNFMGSESFLGIRSLNLFGLPKKIKKGEGATMDAGKAHGVCKEDEYAIYPWNVRNMSDSQELAVVRVVEVEDLVSRAEFIKVNTLSVSEIETGCRAVRIRRQDCIQVMITDEKLHSEFASALEKFKDGAFPLQLIINEEERSGDSNAFYQVSLSATGEYRLLSGLGEVIPFLPISRCPTTILQQAVHLGVFETIRGLKNESKSEGLPVMENQFKFSADIESTISHDGIVNCTFKNESESHVHVTILNFSPLWGVQFLKSKAIDPRSDFSFKMQMTVPDRCGTEKITDTVKCLITVTQTSFDALRMEGMCDNGQFTALRGTSKLLSILQKLRPSLRNANLVDDEDTFQWTSKEIAINTQKKSS